jgi:lysozyme
MRPSSVVPDFLAKPINEGCSLVVYRDQHNLPTIGIGHLLTKSELMSGKILIGGARVEYKGGITLDDAKALCLQDVGIAAAAVNEDVKVALAQCQFDALCLFVFNVGGGQAGFGGSTLLRLLNQGKYEQVPDQMRRWDHVGGIESGGLTARREREILVWEGKAQ